MHLFLAELIASLPTRFSECTRTFRGLTLKDPQKPREQVIITKVSYVRWDQFESHSFAAAKIEEEFHISYFIDNLLHRPISEGPAFISYSNSRLVQENYFWMGSEVSHELVVRRNA